MEDIGVSSRTSHTVYECASCDVSFKSLSQFQKHRITAHIKSIDRIQDNDFQSCSGSEAKREDSGCRSEFKFKAKKYECGICRKLFSLLEELIFHLDTHKPKSASETRKALSDKIAACRNSKNSPRDIVNKAVTDLSQDNGWLDVHTDKKQVDTDEVGNSIVDTQVSTTKSSESKSTNVSRAKNVKKRKAVVLTGDVCKKSKKVMAFSKSKIAVVNSFCDSKQSIDNAVRVPEGTSVVENWKARISKKLKRSPKKGTGKKGSSEGPEQNSVKTKDALVRQFGKASMKPCQFCDRSYSEVRRLKEHLRKVHARDPSHMCTVCWKIYRKSYNLKRHSLIHAIVQLFRCSVCGKQFGQEGKMKEHQAKDHGRLSISSTKFKSERYIKRLQSEEI